MELRRVRYFLAVAEHLNFRRASEALKTSQPSLSQQIRGLEDELGFALFERSKQHVRLTHAGASYLRGMRPIVAEFDACARRARDAHDGSQGTLAIGASGMLMIERVPAAVRAFRRRFPAVDVNVTILRSPDVLAALRHGRLDLAFSAASEFDDDLRSEPLWTFPPRLLLPNDHPRAADPVVDLRDLSGETLILHPHRDGRSAGGNVLALCHDLGFTPGSICEVLDVADIETLVGLVACGLGVSILPSPFEAYLSSPLLAFRTIAGVKRNTHIAAWWRPDDHTPMVKHFLEAARAA